MSTELPQLSLEQRAELDAWEERPLSREEFAARVAVPWSEHELEAFTSHVRWFARRYPSAGERLRATRHLMDQWQRNRLR